MVGLFYNPDEFLNGLIAAVSVPLLKEFVSGASAELAYHQFALQKQAGPLTTAEEYAIQNDIDVGELTDFIEEFQIGLRLPDWMIEKGIESLGESVGKPYWKDIGDTFGSDAANILRDSIERGWSINRIAKELRAQTGDPDSAWAKTRAKNIARTETGHMMNSGHSAGIDQVNDELGEDIFGKEWLSVLGSTTRESHAAMNGQIADKDGMFDLEGYLVPWPSHIDLPPSLRCNCQCSIISSGLEKEIEDNPAPAIDEQADDEEPPPSKAILENMTADEIANTHPVLKEQHEKFVDETESFVNKVDKAREDALVLEAEQKPLWKSFSKADDDLRNAIESNQPEDVISRLREKLQQIAEQHDELTKRIVAIGDRVEGIRAESRAEFVKRFGAEAPAEFELRKGKRTEEVIDGARASTGNPLRRFQDATKEAGDFVRNLVNTGMDSESQHALLDVDIHQGSPKLRAFYRETGSPGKPAGVYAGSKDPPKTIVHELGHHLENRVQGIRDRANQFLDYRLSQSGTESKSMSETSSFYRKDETGNDDDFWRMFTDSKTKPEKPIESAYYVGKRYKSGDTEIVSMGLEQLYRDPARFARRDPEYFRFLTGILNGSIR